MRTGLILGAAALALLVGAGAALAMDPPEDQKPPPEPVWPPGGKASPLPSDTPTCRRARSPRTTSRSRASATRW